MILYIDDEPRYVASFIEELEYEFGEDNIKLTSNTDKAISCFKQNSKKIKIVILDIMMPSGRAFKDEPTKEGLLTGFFLYQYIRTSHHNLPIIIFTNISEDYIFINVDDNLDIAKIINQIKLDIDKNKALFLLKENVFPCELVEEVNKMLL